MAEDDEEITARSRVRTIAKTLLWTTGLAKLEGPLQEQLQVQLLATDARRSVRQADEPPDQNLFEIAAEKRASEVDLDEMGAYQTMTKIIGDAAANPKRVRGQVKKATEEEERKETVREIMRQVVEKYPHDDKNFSSLTDLMAQLIYLMPRTAGLLFDQLLEEIQDGSKHSHLKLEGWFMNDPMLCVYTTLDMSVPENRRKKTEFEMSEGGRDPNVYEVKKYRCLLKNIMDPDILQALAYTNQVQIFAKKSVQAMLYCAWRQLMVPAVRIQTVFVLLELIALLAWGTTTADGDTFDRLNWNVTHHGKDADWLKEHDLPSDAWVGGPTVDRIFAYDSPRHVPSCWNILAASTLRQVINFLWKTCSFYYRAEAAYQAQASSGLQYMGYLWGPQAYFRMIFNTEIPLVVFKITFLCLTFGKQDRVMTSFQQATLSASFALTMISLMVPFRVVASKVALSLMAIKQAVFDPDVVYFLSFMFVMFSFFIFAWEIIDRESTVLCAFVQGFRGLVVGDGDGLDFLGLKTDDDTVTDEEAHKFRVAFGTFGTILFFSYLMNLLIAIFSNTYEKASKQVWLYFHQARVQDLRDNILALHKLKYKGYFMKLMEGIGMDFLFVKPYVWRLGVGLFGSGFFLQFFIHAITHFSDVLFYITTVVSILLLTLGGLVLESAVYAHHNIKSDWFPAKDDQLEHERNLYAFIRADYDDNMFLGTEDLDMELDDIQDKLRKLDAGISNLNKFLEEKITRQASEPKELDADARQASEPEELDADARQASEPEELDG